MDCQDQMNETNKVTLLQPVPFPQTCTEWHPLGRPSFPSPSGLNGLWKQGKWFFPLTTEDALAFTIRHRLLSILHTETTASIIGGDTHETMRTLGRPWLIQIGSFSRITGERRNKQSQMPQVHGFSLPHPHTTRKKKKILSLRIDRQVSGCINTHMCACESF